MLVDANLLVYAVDSESPHHEKAAAWLEASISGPRRVALPVQSIAAFLRLVTHPRVVDNPLSAADAAGFATEWISAPGVWIPPTSRHTVAILTDQMSRERIVGNLVPDAVLAALAIEHGLTVYSNDSDFARFPDCRWVNPLR